MIEADAEVDRRAALRDRVARVHVDVAGLVRAAALAEQLREGDRRRLLQREDAVAGPHRRGRRVDAADSEAVLDVVRGAERRGERVRVDVRRRLRADVRALHRRSVRPRVHEIAARRQIHAALRRQQEAGVVVGVLRRDEHVRRDDAIVGELPEAVQRRAGVGVVLMECRRRRVERDP